ncbi:G-protein coupled receptor GRL101-like [Anabrus simplex]|uniref:G-protein coupled receptor GRL101-like n=1 Tax=Anabrus simplex TaxID=316456 RepID=UPI0035A2977E
MALPAEDTTFVPCNTTVGNISRPILQCDASRCVPSFDTCGGVPDCAETQNDNVAECGCLPNEFRCTNSCVDLVRRCDRHADCPDGEDEQGCETYVCPVTHFKCRNHYCIPQDEVCNFVDNCDDGSDELLCSHRKCWKSEFRCDNGECIQPGFVCDGYFDCIDHSDELNCGPEQFVNCSSGKRIHSYYWCDGWPECPDNHADELHCENCTGENDFLCPNGRCIRLANVCDSQCDCIPLFPNETCADEINCDSWYSRYQGVTQCNQAVTLMCLVPADRTRAQDRCIRPEFICDSHNDCTNGKFLSDEFGCPGSEIHQPPERSLLCSDSRSLPEEEVRCDFKWDCLFGEDERDCEIQPCPVDMFQCDNGQCVNSSHRCNLEFDCWDKSDELRCGNEVCASGDHRCSATGQCVPTSLWCDGVPDCPDASDETDCGWSPDVTCSPSEFTCGDGHCVSARLRCYNSGNPREGCPDRSHLANCRDWPCPLNNFKCRNGPCLNHSLVCNGVIDCEGTWEDEMGCPFPCSRAEPRCECRDRTADCSSLGLRELPDIEEQINIFHMENNFLNFTLNEDTFVSLDRLLYLNLRNNSITWLPPLMFRNLWRLKTLNLQNNRITFLNNNSFFGLTNVSGLYLEGNGIQTLEVMAFYGLSSLPMLDLSYQRLNNISQGAFIGLRHLSGLDLSHNAITTLADGALTGLPQLRELDLSSNSIQRLGNAVFRSAGSLRKLVTDEFRFCCLARHVTLCLPAPDEFSSCEDLMSNLVLRVCVWVLGVGATLGNILVIAWRTRFKHTNQVHSFLITNLAIGDLFMGLYLLIIAAVDAHYRGVYFIHDSAWRSSELCNLAGFISTFSSELSVFTLTVITLDRLLVIIFPFRIRRLDMTSTRILMAGGWVGSAVLSGLPLARINYFRNFYGRSGVCLALHITPEKPSGWEYSVFVFLVLNFVSFFLIALGYLWMYIVARTTQQAAKIETRASEAAMARRMTLIVATDAACWLPIILLGALSLGGVTIPPQVFAWVAVFVLPLNAAVNPVLYTLSTAPFLAPARRGLRTFKMSLTTDPRRTYSSSLGKPYTGKQRLTRHKYRKVTN